MRWVYLSPHFDDAVYSCGAAIWQQTRAGHTVEIWTICAGDPPADRPLTPFARLLHLRWGLDEQVVNARKAEDAAACTLVGASSRRFDIPDCIYRYDPDSGQPVVQDESGLRSYGSHPEPRLVAALAESLAANLHPDQGMPPDVQIAVPLAVGDHTDHRLVRFSAERLNRPLWYYPDAPYVMRRPNPADVYAQAAQVTPAEITTAGLAIWQAAAAAYGSQLSTFWADRIALDEDFARYARQGGGRLLQLKLPERGNSHG